MIKAACGFVVTALDVEVTEERFEEEGCDDGNPGLEKIDEGSVGAELLQDVDWKLALKVPSHSRVAVGKDDPPPSHCRRSGSAVGSNRKEALVRDAIVVLPRGSRRPCR